MITIEANSAMTDERKQEDQWTQEAEASLLEASGIAPPLLTRKAMIDQAIDKMLGLGNYRQPAPNTGLEQSPKQKNSSSAEHQ